MQKNKVIKNYIFLGILLGAMILGGITGWAAPKFAGMIAPLGKVFINMMFCIVVPLVFASISSSVAKMKSKKRAGKILGTTVAVFVITGTIASVIMFVLMKMFPPGLHAWKDVPAYNKACGRISWNMLIGCYNSHKYASCRADGNIKRCI